MWQPDSGTAAPAAAFAPKSGLKQRKKDYLNRRKLKKRGRAVSKAEAGDRLERRLLQDPQRPAFGEQALAPLKVRDICLTSNRHVMTRCSGRGRTTHWCAGCCRACGKETLVAGIW